MSEYADTVIDLAREGLEWCADWKDGQFTPARTADGWTVEMHGLVDHHERICGALLNVWDGIQAEAAKLQPVRDTHVDGCYIDGLYRCTQLIRQTLNEPLPQPKETT